jgi:hypothetical protein
MRTPSEHNSQPTRFSRKLAEAANGIWLLLIANAGHESPDDGGPGQTARKAARAPVWSGSSGKISGTRRLLFLSCSGMDRSLTEIEYPLL